MNYQKIYTDLCQRGSNQKTSKDFKYEKHHIIPKSLGGTNNKSNLVNLTYREHYLAHLLLIKMMKTKRDLIKMTHALFWLCKSNNGLRPVTSRMFEIARKKRAIAQSQFQLEIIGENGETRSQINSRKRAPSFANQELFEWFHPIYGTEILNCYQLSLKYSELTGRSTNLIKVANGERGSCDGWVLEKNKNFDFNAQHRQRMSISAKNRKSTLRTQIIKSDCPF